MTNLISLIKAVDQCTSSYYGYPARKCFRIIKLRKSIEEAEARCKAIGMDLADITSSGENDIAKTQIPSGMVFMIGIKIKQNAFQYVDGTELGVGAYNKLSNEAYLPDNALILLNSNGDWSTATDTLEYFMCSLRQGQLILAFISKWIFLPDIWFSI